MTTEPTTKQKNEAREIPHEWMKANSNGTAALYTTSPQQDDLCARITAALSSRDREIREVLEGLRSNVNHYDLCWCRTQTSIHSPTCLAARALWEKLQK